MDIHKPKAAHSLREFLSEIGTIVVGVLIALAAEQTVQTMHERRAATEAREAVYNEIRQNLSYMNGRMVTQECVEKRLDEIGALIARAGDGAMSPRPTWVGQPSVWFMAAQRWQAATGSGRASLFNGEEQGRLADVYVITSRFADAEASEQAAWAQLRGLETWTGPLGGPGRIHFLAALQQARYELWNTRIAMELAFQRGRKLGVAPAEAKTMGGDYAIPHAVCLPIDTTRQEAIALLAATKSPPWGQPK